MPTVEQFADANNVGVYISEEVKWGCTEEGTDGPDWYESRYTGESLTLEKETVTSETIRDDRQRDDVAEVGYGSTGDLNFELEYSELMKMLVQGALAGTFETNEQSATIDASASGSTITMTTTDDFWEDVEAGDWILVSGLVTASTSNGAYRIISIANDVATVYPAPAADVSAETAVIKSGMCKAGVTKRSFGIEKRYTDLATPLFELFEGERIESMELSVNSKQVATIKFSFMGKKPSIGTSTNSTNDVDRTGTISTMTASVSVKAIAMDGAELATAIKGLTLNVANNLRAQDAVGSQDPVGIGYGFCDVTGSVEAYFEDSSLYDKVINHTTTGLSFVLQDESNNVFGVTIPAVKFTSGGPNAPGGNQDVMQTMNFTAIKDATLDTSLTVSMIGA